MESNNDSSSGGLKPKKAKLLATEVFNATTYKTYRLNNGKKLCVKMKRSGVPGVWSVEGDPRYHRMITSAARARLGRILKAGEIVPRLYPRMHEINPIPQVTPHYILQELFNAPFDEVD